MKNLIAAMAVLVVSTLALPQAHSQEERLSVDDISPVVTSFEVIAGVFGEHSFRYSYVSDDTVRHIRSMVCNVLDTEEGRESVASIINESESVLVEILGSADGGRAVQQDALNGNRFSSFLDAERAALGDSLGLSENAQELLLKLLVRFRPYVATSPVEIDLNHLNDARDKVSVLCHDAHSPALNESHGGWWSWLASGFKFVGGLVIAGADIAIPALHTVRPMSTRFGIGAARTGGWELYTLFVDPRSQGRNSSE